MVRKCFAVLMSFIFMAMIAGVASATYVADITYDYVDNGEGNYTFIFTVYNNSTGSDNAALDFFEIDFDADNSNDYQNYSNITWVVDNGWDKDSYEPTSGFGGVPGCALADDSIFGSDGGGIAQGESLGGFKVSFDYSGTLDPDEQLFSFVADFGTNDQGNGIEINPDGIPNNGDEYWVMGESYGKIRYEPSGPAPVPVPGTIFLLGAGLIGLLGASRKNLNKGV